MPRVRTGPGAKAQALQLGSDLLGGSRSKLLHLCFPSINMDKRGLPHRAVEKRNVYKGANQGHQLGWCTLWLAVSLSSQ